MKMYLMWIYDKSNDTTWSVRMILLHSDCVRMDVEPLDVESSIINDPEQTHMYIFIQNVCFGESLCVLPLCACIQEEDVFSYCRALFSRGFFRSLNIFQFRDETAQMPNANTNKRQKSYTRRVTQSMPCRFAFSGKTQVFAYVFVASFKRSHLANQTERSATTVQ